MAGAILTTQEDDFTTTLTLDPDVATRRKPNIAGATRPIIGAVLTALSHPSQRVPETLLRVDAAIDYVRDWLAQPNVRFLRPGERQLEIAFRMLEGVGTAGNLTTDVQLAALAIEHDAELHSNDTDFGRFADLRWVNPLG